jgi:hypothetical protein
LLFLDADMGFAADLIERIIDFDKPMVGCLYPNRQRKLARLMDAARGGAEPASALDAANTYVGVPLIEDGRAETLGPFIRAREIGTGIMLVKREVLEKLVAAYPELRTDDPVYRGLGMGPISQLFDSFQGPSGMFLGEDVAFCRRWTERCGGEIWACYDAEIAHVGRDVVRGNYANRLPAAQAKAESERALPSVDRLGSVRARHLGSLNIAGVVGERPIGAPDDPNPGSTLGAVPPGVGLRARRPGSSVRPLHGLSYAGLRSP